MNGYKQQKYDTKCDEKCIKVVVEGSRPGQKNHNVKMAAKG
jgi:hypothetical protein